MTAAKPCEVLQERHRLAEAARAGWSVIGGDMDHHCTGTVGDQDVAQVVKITRIWSQSGLFAVIVSLNFQKVYRTRGGWILMRTTAVILFAIMATPALAWDDYVCKGVIKTNGASHPETAFLSVNRHRWWRFWTDNDSSARVEILDGFFDYYGWLKSMDRTLFFYRDSDRSGAIDGYYSTFTNRLFFNAYSGDTFVGTCRRKPE